MDRVQLRLLGVPNADQRQENLGTMASMDVDAASGRRYGMDNEDDERIAAQLDADAEEEEEVVIDPEDVERRLQAMENAMDASDVLAPAFPPVSASELVVRRHCTAHH